MRRVGRQRRRGDLGRSRRRLDGSILSGGKDFEVEGVGGIVRRRRRSGRPRGIHRPGRAAEYSGRFPFLSFRD
jgi:hypothetical protein